MKLVDVGDRGSITMQNSFDVVKECSVDGALAGHQCDEIMLNLVDLARLQKLSHLEMREWLGKMQTKIRIKFDPRIVK